MSELFDSKKSFQEVEYWLPYHWLLRKHGLVAYIRKTALMAQMVREAGLVGGRALDVGCGDGRGTYELARMLGSGWEWEGIDINERAIAFARLMAPGIRFEVHDARSLPYDSGSFDLVVAREVIENIHPSEINVFLSEIHWVLKPTGKFLLTTPSEKRRVPEKHYQHFSAEKLQRLLNGAGFKVECIRGFGWWPPAWFEPTYRFILGLPYIWRIHVLVGTHEMPVSKADCLLVLASKRKKDETSKNLNYCKCVES